MNDVRDDDRSAYDVSRDNVSRDKGTPSPSAGFAERVLARAGVVAPATATRPAVAATLAAALAVVTLAFRLLSRLIAQERSESYVEAV